jgi:hypothetical protein
MYPEVHTHVDATLVGVVWRNNATHQHHNGSIYSSCAFPPKGKCLNPLKNPLNWSPNPYNKFGPICTTKLEDSKNSTELYTTMIKLHGNTNKLSRVPKPQEKQATGTRTQK